MPSIVLVAPTTAEKQTKDFPQFFGHIRNVCPGNLFLIFTQTLHLKVFWATFYIVPPSIRMVVFPF